jgi:hypothetical protein
MSIKPDTDLAQVQDHLVKLLKEDRDDDALTIVMDLLSTLRRKDNELQLRIHKILTQKYRKKGEGISTTQLKLFLEKAADKDPAAQKVLERLDLEEEDDEDDDDDEDKGTITAVRGTSAQQQTQARPTVRRASRPRCAGQRGRPPVPRLWQNQDGVWS